MVESLYEDGRVDRIDRSRAISQLLVLDALHLIPRVPAWAWCGSNHFGSNARDNAECTSRVSSTVSG